MIKDPSRIVLLADIHLGTRETQFPGQDYVYAADLLRMAVPRVRSLAPDEVIVLGDLVNMGTASEYELANAILDELRVRTTVIPGNHEVVKGTVAEFVKSARGATLDAGQFDSGGPSIVLLNSAIEGLTPWQWHGKVGPEGLSLLDRATAQHPDRAMIVFCHHPPDGTVHVPAYPMMGLVNSDEVMARFARHPSPVVMFCGHTHVPDVYRRRNVTIVACPALCFWPHALLLMERQGPWLTLRTHRLIESPEQSPDPHLRSPQYLAERESWVPEITVRIGPETRGSLASRADRG